MSYDSLIIGSTFISVLPPTGSIAAYLGTTDPTGWVICDGIVRTNNSDGKYNKLNSYGIGTGGGSTSSYTPPDFDGLFLRGTGTVGVYVGPNMRTFQDQQIVDHGHNTEFHNHSTVSNTAGNWYCNRVDGAGTVGSFTTSAAQFNMKRNYQFMTTSTTGQTDVTSNTDANNVAGASGGTQLAPYCYGVNWMMKL